MKPCPYCKGETIHWSASFDPNLSWLECKKCHAKTERSYGDLAIGDWERGEIYRNGEETN